MAAILKDRVQETSATSGTGPLTLAGAVPGFVSFGSVMAIGDTCRYCIVDGTANAWEVGVGTYTAASRLARATVEASSNGGTAINLVGNAGTVVFMTASAAMLSKLGPTFSINGGFSMVPGRYYAPSGTAVITGTGADTTTTYYLPMMIPSPIVATSLSISIRGGASSAAGNHNLGIYADSGGSPGNLLSQVTVTAPANTTATLKGVINQLLPAGIVWLAIQSGAATMVCYLTGGTTQEMLGTDYIPNVVQPASLSIVSGYQSFDAYAAAGSLPPNGSTNGYFVSSPVSAYKSPMIWLGV